MRLQKLRFLCILITGWASLAAQTAQTFQPNLPWIDLSREKERQTILSAGTETLYNGHPTTVMLADHRTLFCTWTYGHGGRTGFLARSNDTGKTWEFLSIPADWANTGNCPSIYRLTDPQGIERLMLFTAYPEMSQTYSEDLGKTWSPVRSLRKPCVMAFTSVIRLKNGSYLGMYHRGKNDEDRPPLTLWQARSDDGGLTWGPSEKVGEIEGRYPCEPCVFRSPDGNRLVCVARDNSRKGTSLLMFSDDEGNSWSPLRDTPWGLTGDRHIIKYLPDGRLIAVFRDMAPASPTKGHFVAWIGHYADFINGTSGQYRVKLLHSFAGWDCGYPGLEILPDGTVIAITYIQIHPGKEKHSIVEIRFKPEETDPRL